MDDKTALGTQNFLRQCIREQYDEVEMLQSIFCNAGEMKIDDHSILTDMFDYLEEKSDRLTKKLDYTITIPITSQAGQILELQFEFPHRYPLEEPCITVRTTLHVPNKLQIENEIKRQIYDHLNGGEVD